MNLLRVSRSVTALVLGSLGFFVTLVAVEQRANAATEPPLRLTSGADLPTLNPLLSNNWDLNILSELWHGFLLRTDARGQLVPDLATEVPTIANGGIARDGLAITYRLRTDARWHDGHPFTADDVVFSFRAVRNAKNNVVDRSGFDDIARAIALDAHTVRVTLAHRYTPAVATFFATGANAPYPILPAHLLATLPDLNRAAYNALPIGLGPYRVVRWDRGTRITLERDPHYFRGPAKIARIEIAAIPNPNTALTVFRSGGLDLFSITGLSGSAQSYATAKAVPHTVARANDKFDFDYVEFNVARAPLSELAVRRAIVQGVDRERIMTILAGELHRAGGTDRAPGSFAYDPAIQEPPFDLAAAKRTLDAAGWRQNGTYRTRGGTTLALEIAAPAGFPFFESFGVQMQSALRALGIDASLHLYPQSLLESPMQDGGILTGGKFDLTLSYWSPGNVNDHSYLFRCDERPPKGQNLSRVCDPAIDRDAAIELEATDPAREAAADRRIMRRVIDRAYTLYFGFERAGSVWRDDLHGIAPTPLGRTFWNAATWTRKGS